MNQLIKDVKFAISLKRPHGGIGVTTLCDYIIDRANNCYVFVDYSGNIHIDLRENEEHRTLFTAHVDTVHRKDGSNSFTQLKSNNGRWLLAGEKNEPLGADNAAGVAILLHLIDNKIPGYYIFFQGEEKGGVGSSWLAVNSPGLLQEFDRAIAFDRKGEFSVISSQMGGRCCSDDFAYDLSNSLNEVEDTFMYIPDDTGIYTDTAEFTELIPECTNVSVGYYHEHTDNEKLNLTHLEKLAKAVVKVKWDSLITSRNPHEVVYDTRRSYPSSEEFQYERPDTYTATAHRLVDAINDAKYGIKKELINQIAQHAYSEDPELAKRFLRETKLKDEVLFDAEEMLNAGYDESYVYDYLFDRIYQE